MTWVIRPWPVLWKRICAIASLSRCSSPSLSCCTPRWVSICSSCTYLLLSASIRTGYCWSFPLRWCGGRLDFSFRCLACSTQPHAQYERTGELGRPGGLLLQCLCDLVCTPGGDQLRRGSYARHLRAVRPLDGDAQPPGFL